MIFHITTQSQWDTAVSTGIYRDQSLSSEGFIHCSTEKQLLGTANNYFSGQIGLLVLCITPENVTAPIVFEDSYGSGQEFPHIYGPLNSNAVTSVIALTTNDDGSFGLIGKLDQQFCFEE